jgi:glycosyltransferase involved in cell wall biosynthesis
MVPAVSIVIPTYNRGEILCQTMSLALAQAYPTFEVIVVDQSPELQETVSRFVSEAGPRLKYVRRAIPNLPAARNEGVRLASGDIIVFIDDDVLIEPNFIESHVRHFKDDRIGCVAGLMVPPEALDDFQVLESLLADTNMRRVRPDGCYEVEWAFGGNFSVRKIAYLKAGMSDERFTGSAWCEDADLGIRLGRVGYQVIVDPKVRLLHLALKAGGCQNRSAEFEGRIREEHHLFQIFHVAKNWSAVGTQRVLGNMWHQYRNFALNRPNVLAPKRLLSRHVRFARILLSVARMCLEKPPAPVDLPS